ncbi:uncharacterized protein LOC142173416 [Nicotiana tabacum]|uniref:Uncharacterized protein LOC142173416 n=1 Tax=Nicotiana tabacum TaxID=4097 RepID=A0AC58TD00_TOBAC
MGKPGRSPLLTRVQFSMVFLEHFIHRTRREEVRRQFEYLQQGPMLVTEYEIMYKELSRHATILIPTKEERLRISIDGFHHGQGRFRGDQSIIYRQPVKELVCSLHSVHFHHRVLNSSSGYYGSRTDCYTTHSASYPRHGRPRGGAQSSGGQAICYAFLGRTEAVASDTVITFIIFVCNKDASVMFDPGSTYSYVSSYFASRMDMPHGSLDAPMHMSIPVGDSIMAQQMVEKGCLAYLAFIRDASADTPAVESVPVVREFLYMFQAGLQGKANMVEDSLSRKAESMGNFAFIPTKERPLAMDVQALAIRFIRLDISKPTRVLACVVSRLCLFERLKAFQYSDPYLLVRATKMYLDLKKHYWWGRMKKHIVGFVARCSNCQQDKGFPRALRRFDVVWVILDRLTKCAHFIPVMTSYTGAVG